MKAAILSQYGESPKYSEANDPIPHEGEVMVEMVATSIKQVDKLKAAGKHYTKYPILPAIVGLDGIARLKDGTHAYISGVTGTMSEKALTVQDSWVLVPEDLPVALAAALPNALIGSDAAMLYRGGLKKGDKVMIHGATGATGRVAIQMAKNRGADCVIAIGRASSGLFELTDLGADVLIDTEQDEEDYRNDLTKALRIHQPEVTIDYLWGHPTELILKVMNEVIEKEVKFVTVGDMAGTNISLSSALLRSRKITLLGSGIGSISYNQIKEYFSAELPIVYKWAEEGKIIMPLQTVKLSEIETAWETPEDKGKRIVVII